MDRSPLTPTLSRRGLLLGLLPCGVVVAVAVILYPFLPRADPHGYHEFADRRTWAGIPNFADVVSNVPFVIIGAAGLALFHGRAPAVWLMDSRERTIYRVLFLGVCLTGFGSAYYHLQPNEDRLVWDRLPMTVIFTSFFAAVIAERVSLRLASVRVWPLLLVGVGSLIWWKLADDLRPYILVQFVPLIMIPLMLLCFPGRYSSTFDLLIVLGWYGIAKVCELGDQKIFDFLGGAISGHTWKHLASAAGALWLLWTLRKRRSNRAAPVGSEAARDLHVVGN